MSEVIKNLDTFLEKTLPATLMRGVTDMCMDIRNKAVQKCPVDTGITRASLTMEVQEVKNGVDGAVGTNVESSIYVHEGTGLYAKDGNGRKQVPWVYKTPDGAYHSTKGQKPNPFLQDAVDEVRPHALRYFEGGMR